MNRFLPLRLHLILAIATAVVSILLVANNEMSTLPQLLLFFFPIFMYFVRIATGERAGN
ncbi:hypothetical protein [uncultured Pontibacter sp.]|uniref:hypothetical protein n=1 Tax=uncultured Pontibacter sp. TaxID=453356 RepID=UPI0026097690|nr:hypothetical protein [uncultured Pontibacter sp.]